MHRWNRMAVMLVLMCLPGCVRWKQVPVPTPPAPPNVVSNMSRIRLTNGQSVEFLTLVVATDSLFGIRNNLARTRMSISFDQVQRIEVRQKDPLRTLAVIGLIAAGIFFSGAAGIEPR
ncbi:MAG TPA: hypothetical protein VFZ73_08205 [Gemmatimonadaceae bacterium]